MLVCVSALVFFSILDTVIWCTDTHTDKVFLGGRISFRFDIDVSDIVGVGQWETPPFVTDNLFQRGPPCPPYPPSPPMDLGLVIYMELDILTCL